MPKCYKLLFIYMAWAVLLSAVAAIVLQSGKTILNEIVQRLITISILVGIIVAVLLIIFILFERKIAEDSKTNTNRNIKKQRPVGNLITDFHRSTNIPKCLSNKCQSEDYKRNAKKCCNDTGNKPKFFHLVLSALCSIKRIIPKKGSVKKRITLNTK